MGVARRWRETRGVSSRPPNGPSRGRTTAGDRRAGSGARPGSCSRSTSPRVRADDRRSRPGVRSGRAARRIRAPSRRRRTLDGLADGHLCGARAGFGPAGDARDGARGRDRRASECVGEPGSRTVRGRSGRRRASHFGRHETGTSTTATARPNGERCVRGHASMRAGAPFPCYLWREEFRVRSDRPPPRPASTRSPRPGTASCSPDRRGGSGNHARSRAARALPRRAGPASQARASGRRARLAKTRNPSPLVRRNDLLADSDRAPGRDRGRPASRRASPRTAGSGVSPTTAPERSTRSNCRPSA